MKDKTYEEIYKEEQLYERIRSLEYKVRVLEESMSQLLEILQMHYQKKGD